MRSETMKKIRRVGLMVLCYVVIPSVILAAPADTSKLDTIINDVVVPWVTKIGFIVAFIGGIMFAEGWRNDDADSRARGMKTLVSGFMMAGVAGAYSMFS